MSLLGVGLDRTLLAPLLLIIYIGVTHLEEFQVLALVVDAAGYALQTAEEHGLTHHAEISTQWVHHLHGCLVRILVEVEVGIVA